MAKKKKKQNKKKPKSKTEDKKKKKNEIQEWIDKGLKKGYDASYLNKQAEIYKLEKEIYELLKED